MDMFDLLERNYDRLLDMTREMLSGAADDRREVVRAEIARELRVLIENLEHDLFPLLAEVTSTADLVSLTRSELPRMREYADRIEAGDDADVYTALGDLLAEQTRRAHTRIHPRAKQEVSEQVAIQTGQAMLRKRAEVLGRP